MITVALPKELGSKGFVTTVEALTLEDALAKRIS